MSFLEVRDRGLPYGSIPYQELLNKLEETDTNETIEDHMDNYNNYIRSEIIDRSLDKPFLESDKTRRDGSLSKSIINLRYNGARGEYEHPVHPELFVGFIDQDPRALDNNPRMNEYQKQIATRMPNLEIRMGYNCTDTDHETPWTNQSLDQCRRDIQTSLAYNTKVFTDERDGRALNRNFVTDYDHNKKSLIYKDILPSGINGITENESGKSNTSYTTSAVPFVSTDTNFTPSYKNINNYLIPGQKSCQRHTGQDQISQEEYESKKTMTYALQQESKMKTINDDQNYNEHFNNITMSNKLPGTKYTANETNNNINVSDIESANIGIFKNKLVNPITNSKIIDNDPSFHESSYVDNKQVDNIKFSNANNYIIADLHCSNITDHDTNNKKHCKQCCNNITLINSSFYIPEYKFRHLEITKNGHIPDNQTIMTKIRYDNQYGSQEESHIKANRYIFSDNIGKVMVYNTATVPDTTNETQLRSIGNAQQEHKMKTINSEDVWFMSDENTAGKTQKQSRNGGIEPIVMDVPESHDFEIKNGGSIIGKKSIRGDKLSQEVSETENIYDLDHWYE